MSNPPHGISVDNYYQEQIAKPFEVSSKLESSPPRGLTPSPGSQTPSQMMMRTNHGSISVRMKLITPSVGDSDRYSGNGFGTTLPEIPGAGRKSSRASFPPSCYGSPYESLHPQEIKEGHPLDNRIVDDYWVNPGARTDSALLTEAAWRNRFRESTAKVNWRQRIQEETDRDRRERRLVRIGPKFFHLSPLVGRDLTSPPPCRECPHIVGPLALHACICLLFIPVLTGMDSGIHGAHPPPPLRLRTLQHRCLLRRLLPAARRTPRRRLPHLRRRPAPVLCPQRAKAAGYGGRHRRPRHRFPVHGPPDDPHAPVRRLHTRHPRPPPGPQASTHAHKLSTRTYVTRERARTHPFTACHRNRIAEHAPAS
jgi:hypothetical protein